MKKYTAIASAIITIALLIASSRSADAFQFSIGLISNAGIGYFPGKDWDNYLDRYT